VRVRRIVTADYPTPARRPANSRLDNSKLARTHGIALPHWRASLDVCVDRLLDATPCTRIG
jgi:dTDP-4-dehydrorhamnose reductase